VTIYPSRIELKCLKQYLEFESCGWKKCGCREKSHERWSIKFFNRD